MDINNSVRVIKNIPKSFSQFSYQFDFCLRIFILFVSCTFYVSCIHQGEKSDNLIGNNNISAPQILSASKDAMALLHSFHFKSTGSIKVANNLVLTQIEGDIVQPDYMNLNISGSYSSGLVFKTKVVTHNGNNLILNPLNKKWEPVSGNLNPTNFFTPHKGISQIMNQVYDVKFSSTDNENDYYSLNGKLDSQSLNYLIGLIPQQPPINVRLLIDKNNKFLYQAKLNGKFTDLNSYNDLLLNITNPNKPVKIEIPSSD